MTDFQLKYLIEHFSSMPDYKRIELLVLFYTELEKQEIVGGCPIDDEDLIRKPDLTPYWAHTGEPLEARNLANLSSN